MLPDDHEVDITVSGLLGLSHRTKYERDTSIGMLESLGEDFDEPGCLYDQLVNIGVEGVVSIRPVVGPVAAAACGHQIQARELAQLLSNGGFVEPRPPRQLPDMDFSIPEAEENLPDFLYLDGCIV